MAREKLGSRLTSPGMEAGGRTSRTPGAAPQPAAPEHRQWHGGARTREVPGPRSASAASPWEVVAAMAANETSAAVVAGTADMMEVVAAGTAGMMEVVAAGCSWAAD